jgi:hypothetical membrane protein
MKTERASESVLSSRRLLQAGVFGCIFFVLLFLLQGIARENYSSFKHPVSSLSIGEYGWIQRFNFIICGGAILLSSFGFRNLINDKRANGIGYLLAGAGIGLIGAGLFSTDPIYGYPTTAPLALSQFTSTGHLHDIFSLLFFICVPIACYRTSRTMRSLGNRNMTYVSIAAAVLMLVFFSLAALGFRQSPSLVSVAGLFQRLSIITGLGWIVFIYMDLIKSSEENLSSWR